MHLDGGKAIRREGQLDSREEAADRLVVRVEGQQGLERESGAPADVDGQSEIVKQEAAVDILDRVPRVRVRQTAALETVELQTQSLVLREHRQQRGQEQIGLDIQLTIRQV